MWGVAGDADKCSAGGCGESREATADNLVYDEALVGGEGVVGAGDVEKVPWSLVNTQLILGMKMWEEELGVIHQGHSPSFLELRCNHWPIHVSKKSVYHSNGCNSRYLNLIQTPESFALLAPSPSYPPPPRHESPVSVVPLPSRGKERQIVVAY